MCRTVHDEIDFDVPPKKVYDALMDSKSHAQFTSAPAKIGRKVGDRFTAGGSYISGYNLDLVPSKRIVQAWRGSDWPKGEYSIVTYAIRGRGRGSRLTFDQKGIPEDAEMGASAEEWQQYYWEPMQRFFAENGRKQR